MKTHSSIDLETRRVNLSTAPQEANRRFLRQSLQTVWRWLVDAMTCSHEVCVWQSCDRDGLIRWHAYNPVSQQKATRHSEAEIIDWIEQSYHPLIR